MIFSLKNSVKSAINTIENAGGEAYLVGGCVRDMLLGLSPSDYDLTTSLLPEEVIAIFEKTIPTGIEHGTVTVIIDNEPLEITTFRTDGNYLDSRHPSNVSFVRNISDDLARRDFTVNAIAYNPKTGIIDPFDGIADIKNKILRTVGDPYTRFTEDALRIMRLFRFAAQLNFNIEKNTLSASIELSNNLSTISRERIAAEIFKTLLSENFNKALPIFKTAALEFCKIKPIITEIDFTAIPKERNLRFYIFLKASHSNFEEVCKNLKTDRVLQKYCKEVTTLLASPPQNIKECKRYLNMYDSKSIEGAMILNNINTEILSKVINGNEPYRISDLSINGNDLRQLGLNGAAIGKKLNEILEIVINDPTLNKREYLLDIARNSNK